MSVFQKILHTYWMDDSVVLHYYPGRWFDNPWLCLTCQLEKCSCTEKSSDVIILSSSMGTLGDHKIQCQASQQILGNLLSTNW